MWTWLDGNGNETVIKEYDEIANNFFIGNYYGQEAVDNDDGSAYYETHHNFFAYAGTGMKNDFNGHDNHHHDNLYGYIGACGHRAGAAPRAGARHGTRVSLVPHPSTTPRYHTLGSAAGRRAAPTQTHLPVPLRVFFAL